jgi:outer membrane biogenesis lipoprotein LolB
MTRLLAGAALVLALSACAARLPPRPGGDATPDPTAIQAFEAATSQCRGLRTLKAELSLSGQANGDRIRGRVHSGFESGGALRLEGIAPFGPPAFILAGRDDTATLQMRDRRVLANTRVSQVLERLTGLSLGADDLRLMLSGCLVENPTPTDGKRWASGWRAVSLGNERVAYLRQQQGVEVVVAAEFGPWAVDYSQHANGWPREVRVRRREAGAVDVTARIGQLETNVPIDARAFSVDVPADAVPMTLDDLGSAAPLAPQKPS